jgi:hypothetical protein
MTDYFQIDEDIVVYAPEPKNVDIDLYDRLINIVKDHSIADISLPEKMAPIIDDSIMCINGMCVQDFFWNCYNCDYCRSSCGIKFWYCYDCNKDMCDLCYNEVNEEIAEKNGSVHYHLRKDSLAACRTHNLRIGTARLRKECDICKKPVPIMKKFYNDSDADYDICLDCYSKDSTKEAIRDKNVVLVDDDLCFGSIKDWIEILTDNNGNSILCNLNMDSKYHKRFAFLAVDGHGRSGYYISKDTDLNALLEEYKQTKLFRDSREEEGGEEDDQYSDYSGLNGELDINCKLALMMLKRGMKVYYG